MEKSVHDVSCGAALVACSMWALSAARPALASPRLARRCWITSNASQQWILCSMARLEWNLPGLRNGPEDWPIWEGPNEYVMMNDLLRGPKDPFYGVGPYYSESKESMLQLCLSSFMLAWRMPEDVAAPADTSPEATSQPEEAPATPLVSSSAHSNPAYEFGEGVSSQDCPAFELDRADSLNASAGGVTVPVIGPCTVRSGSSSGSADGGSGGASPRLTAGRTGAATCDGGLPAGFAANGAQVNGLFEADEGVVVRGCELFELQDADSCSGSSSSASNSSSGIAPGAFSAARRTSMSIAPCTAVSGSRSLGRSSGAIGSASKARQGPMRPACSAAASRVASSCLEAAAAAGAGVAPAKPTRRQQHEGRRSAQASKRAAQQQAQRVRAAQEARRVRSAQAAAVAAVTDPTLPSFMRPTAASLGRAAQPSTAARVAKKR